MPQHPVASGSQSSGQAAPIQRHRKAGSTSARGLTASRTLLIYLAVLPLLFLVLASPSSRGNGHTDLFDQLVLDTEPRSALILTAHPDDEVMFFSPTILALQREGWEVRGLCLSAGNADNLGDRRKSELYGSYERLGLGRDKVSLLDHPYLQDGMNKIWSSSLVSTVLDEHLRVHPASLIITFDASGITQHPNHIALPHGCSFVPRSSPGRCIALQSPSLISKFSGPLLPLAYRLGELLGPTRSSGQSGEGEEHKGEMKRQGTEIRYRGSITIVNDLQGWFQGLRAMMAHRSQLVWFRWLYLCFSQLMWVNELKELPDHG